MNIFSRTDEGLADQQSAWGVGRARYDTTNNCPVVRAYHSRQGYRVFRPSLYALESPARNKRTGTEDDCDSIFFIPGTWYVCDRTAVKEKSKKKMKVCFYVTCSVPAYVCGVGTCFCVPAYVCGVGTTDGGWSFWSAEDPSDRAARRLQDLHHRPGASRQVLSRGRGLHATVSSALPVATSVHTRRPRTRGCWHVRGDRRHLLFHIYIWYPYFIVFLCFKQSAVLL